VAQDGRAADSRSSQRRQRLAEYLFLSSVSPAAVHLDACRRLRGENAAQAFCSLGLAKLGEDNGRVPERLVNVLCRAAVHRWRGGIDPVSGADRIKLSEIDRIIEDPVRSQKLMSFAEVLATNHLRNTGVSAAGFADTVRRVIERKLGDDCESYFDKLIDDALRRSSAGRLDACSRRALRIIDAAFGRDESLSEEQSVAIESIRAVLAPAAEQLGRETGMALNAWILDLVDDPVMRVAGGRRVASQAISVLNNLRENTAVQKAELEREIERERETIATAVSNRKLVAKFTVASMSQRLMHYARLQLALGVADATITAATKVEVYLTRAEDELRNYWSTLSRLAEVFENADPDGFETAGDGCGEISLHGEEFLKQQAEFIERFDNDLQAQVFDAEMTLRGVLTHHSEFRTELVAAMRSTARRTLFEIQRQRNIEKWKNNATERLEADSQPLRAALTSSEPNLLAEGGLKRVLLLAPETVDRGQLSKFVEEIEGVPPACCEDPSGAISVIAEVEQIELDRLLRRLVRADPNVHELADRLHTRTDVDWRATSL